MEGSRGIWKEFSRGMAVVGSGRTLGGVEGSKGKCLLE